MSSLRKLIAKAILDIEKYRSPDISEAQEGINEILEAAGLGTTASDTITSIYVPEDPQEWLRISTTYYPKSCECSNDFSFPAFLIDEENPVQAAKKWGLKSEVSQLKAKVKEAQRLVAHWGSQLAVKETEYSEFLSQSVEPEAVNSPKSI